MEKEKNKKIERRRGRKSLIVVNSRTPFQGLPLRKLRKLASIEGHGTREHGRAKKVGFATTRKEEGRKEGRKERM
jgi:hypothetical protein